MTLVAAKQTAIGLWWACLLFIATSTATNAQVRSRNVELHGNAFTTFLDQNTVRGGTSFQSTGWLMTSLTATGRKGELGARAMITVDPITLGDCGHPRILTGQLAICEEKRLEDRMGSHPLFMDLSAHAARRFSTATLSLRLGLVGEPALGPTSFLHRVSASFDPVLPLTSFDLNPAHISNGFATVGVAVGRISVEASSFNSGGGDDNPYDLDPGRFQSWAGRMQLRIGRASRWQVSGAELDSESTGAHAGHGGVTGKVRVLTSSLEGDAAFEGITLNGMLGWSRQSLGGLNTDALLAEALLQFGRHALSLRAESLERVDQEEIFGPIQPDGSHEHTIVNHVFRNSEIAVAYSLRLIELFGLQTRTGVRGAVTFIPEFLQVDYGHTRARAFAVFLNVQPAAERRDHVH